MNCALLRILTLGILAIATASCRLDGKYNIGGIVTGLRGSGLVLEDNSGSALRVAGNGTFRFSGGIAKAGTYSVTVKTQPSNPSQTCTVRNGGGTVGRSDITNVIVRCTYPARFAYVVNQLSNTISAFVINSNNGFLTPIAGAPFLSTGTTPVAAAVDPNQRFLYVVNNASNSVSAYLIDDATGLLSVSGLLIATGTGPAAIAIDPSGRYMYIANVGDNSVSAYVLNGTNGAATPITGSPYRVGTQPVSLTVDPDGRYLYVTNFGAGTVSSLAINPDTGQLSGGSGSPFTVGTGPLSMAIDPTGAYAYVANETSKSISSFTVDGVSGALTAVSGSPLSTGTSPEALAINPAGTYVFATNVTSLDRTAVYAITSGSGALKEQSGVATLALPLAVAIDAAGTFAYVADANSGAVSVYSINPSSGALTQVPGSPFAAGSGPRSIAID